jgi:hypothetical protein
MTKYLDWMMKLTWKDYLYIVFWVFFITLATYFFMNLSTVKNNPCQVCVEKYNLECWGIKDKSLHIYAGFNWNGSARLRLLINEVNDNFTINPNFSDFNLQR